MNSWHTFSLGALPVSRWRNGGGETREIISWPLNTPDFSWRASIATIAADGPFSAFPGIDRSITLLSGAGVHLSDNGQINHALSIIGAPFPFSGDLSLSARLLGGTTMDFNLMARRGVCASRVVALRESSVVTQEKGGVLYAIEGDWQLPDGTRFGRGEGFWWATADVSAQAQWVISPCAENGLLLWAMVTD